MGVHKEVGPKFAQDTSPSILCVYTQYKNNKTIKEKGLQFSVWGPTIFVGVRNCDVIGCMFNVHVYLGLDLATSTGCSFRNTSPKGWLGYGCYPHLSDSHPTIPGCLLDYLVCNQLLITRVRLIVKHRTTSTQGIIIKNRNTLISSYFC